MEIVQTTTPRIFTPHKQPIVFILPAVYRCSNIDGSYDASVSYKSDLLQAEETNH